MYERNTIKNQKIMRNLLFLLLALPMLATAEQVPYSCGVGNPFTIRIPVKLEGMTVQYRWYRNDTLIAGTTATLPPNEKAIAYTIPADKAYGDNVAFHFEYCLNDECSDVWTRSSRYIVNFTTCLKPESSAITGSVTVVCVNTTGLTYSVTSQQDVSYIWSAPTGWTITAGQNTSSITAAAGASAVSGNISVTPVYYGCTGTTKTLAVTVKATSTLTRSGGAASQTVCQNSAITSIVYTRGGSATGSNISWSPSTPTGISTSTSGSTRTISGTPTGSGTFTYTITTTGSSPCAEVTATGTITVNAASTLTRSGGAASQTVCRNSAVTNIVYTRGGSATNSSISWSPSTPAGISFNTSTGTISGTPTSSGTFNYTVTTSGHTSPCTAVTATGTITVNSVPLQPTIIVGTAKVCTNQTGLTYSVPDQTDGVSYAWALPSGWTQTEGGSSRNIIVKAGTAAGNITATPGNTCGSGSSRSLAVSTVACQPSTCAGLDQVGFIGVDNCTPPGVIGVLGVTQ